MKNILKNSLFTLSLILTLLFTSCETMDLNGLSNDNEIGPNLNDPVYGFNYVQVYLASFVDNANDITQKLTRQYAMTSGKTYDNAFEPVNSNGTWGTAYSILATIKGYEDKAVTNRQYELLGASKIIRAYVMITLVDLFGDVPYTEALLGNKNLNPKFDKGEDVYKAALLELDDAILLLDKANNNADDAFLPYDLYYGTTTAKKLNKTNWKTLAKTLKFRAYVTARKNGAALGVNISTELTSLMAGDLIDTQEEDFTFKYGIDDFTSPLSSRHPDFNNAYISGRTPPYISNYMLWTMVREKPKLINNVTNDENLTDPRTLYYFSNQTDDVNKADAVAFPNRFASRPDHFNDPKYASIYRFNRLTPFLYTKTAINSASSPYWGSDHGNNTGRPQDGDKVTVVGVYPAGGRYGNGTAVQSDAGTKGQKGAGIMPIVLSSYVRFLKAEVQLTIFSNPLLAKTEMLAGVNASITKSATLFSGLPQPSVTVVNNYRDFVDNFYTNNPNKQLEAIMKEYFIASWGNGIETYNNYRRTGFPSNFQPTIELSSGDYYTTLFYPSDSQSNNQNKPANLKTRKVFWDVNSPILN